VLPDIAMRRAPRLDRAGRAIVARRGWRAVAGGGEV